MGAPPGSCLSVHQRGIVELRNKGAMQTFWLTANEEWEAWRQTLLDPYDRPDAISSMFFGLAERASAGLQRMSPSGRPSPAVDDDRTCEAVGPVPI